MDRLPKSIEEKKMEIKTKITGVVILLALLLASLMAYGAVPEPSAPSDMDISSNESPAPSVGPLINISGGTISRISFNTTTQNYRWKGFVGNISGRLVLGDAQSRALYDWDINTLTGEVYATRKSSLPDWESISCAQGQTISAEQRSLNISTNSTDSINRTFSKLTHDTFYVGTKEIEENTCQSTALNVNGTSQSQYFQEVLLEDGSWLVYTSLLENSTYGFDNNSYDFQMIVAENALQGSQPNEAYYFYVELI